MISVFLMADVTPFLTVCIAYTVVSHLFFETSCPNLLFFQMLARNSFVIHGYSFL